MVDHGIFYVFDPGGSGSDISAHSSANIGVGLSQLTSRPHIPISKEKFSPLNPVPDYRRLHSHLQKLI